MIYFLFLSSMIFLFITISSNFLHIYDIHTRIFLFLLLLHFFFLTVLLLNYSVMPSDYILKVMFATRFVQHLSSLLDKILSRFKEFPFWIA